MAANRIRIGIIGASTRYGFGMRAHLPALLALPEYELTAVCTSRKETAEDSAGHYGARHAFHDYEKMAEHPDVDLVTVCVRVPQHHAMVMAALNAGKHVYCEWPLGANLPEAEEMAGLAQAKGVRHMVGLQARGAPEVLFIRELVAEGYVGEVLACNMTLFSSGLLQRGADRAWMADKDNGAHTLSIPSGHAIDALCFCVGEFQEISARVATTVPAWETSVAGRTVEVTAPDNVLVSGVLTGGAVVSVHVATVPWHGTGWRMEVYGRDGTLVASSRQTVQYGQIAVRGARDADAELTELPVPQRLTRVPAGVPANEPFNVAQMYSRLGEAISQGHEAEPDFGLAVKRHRLLDALQRSSELGASQQVT